MGGFFIDDVIRMIARNVRRGIRLSRAAKWPVTEARVLRFRTEDGIGHRLRPIVDYSYEVNRETQRGFATGFPVGHREINQIGDSVDMLQTMRVRYDPIDPYSNRVLNEDNPNLPFEVDHDVS
jgi:hypothetical protein